MRVVRISKKLYIQFKICLQYISKFKDIMELFFGPLRTIKTYFLTNNLL